MSYTITKERTDTNKDVYVYNISEQRVPLNSLYSPEKEAERFLKKLLETKKHFVIFIGFANGTLLEKLIESEVYAENIHFLFIEPFTEIELQEKHINVISSTEKISFVYAKNFTSLFFANYLSKFIGISVTIQIHPNYTKLNEPKIKECLNVIKAGTETKKVLNTTEMKFAIDWILEPLSNIESIARSTNIRELEGKFKGERAMLLASGPSLQTHMDFISKNKSGFHLFALGPSLRALLASNIEPDFVLSLDSSKVNYETHFNEVDYYGTLIYETVSNSQIQSFHKGNLIVAKSSADHVTPPLFPDLYSLPNPSPSVAVFALQVINYLGFSEVYFVGQDLALIDGNYYAEGIKQHDATKVMKEELTVESNQGNQVGTTRSLKIFLESFEYIIKTLQADIKIYNLSQKGAKIVGATYIDERSIATSKKNLISIYKEPIQSNSNPKVFIKDFVRQLISLNKEVKHALTKLNKYLKLGVVTSKDMEKVLNDYRKITTNEILDKVILTHLTFMFKRIANTFSMMDNKKNYISKDYLKMIKELENFYLLVSKYSEELLKDERLNR